MPTKTTVLLGTLELMDEFTLPYGKVIYQVISAKVSSVLLKYGTRDVYNTATKKASRMKCSQHVQKTNSIIS